ncbi:MarR family transcriptional regulator [Umezawaea sp. Da 62-37]|uniref:MarR family winged helix-turn-helix transcriptional regulator n=1 Tax=Umezawaea sp. Da 62-37 TaxID=3075927 RepID=UPI0028F73667|nr:MarR family transcriptional regulator [Umezawaea sp. Da 62-37]WNV89532.1 MarR family transcriptional regulator [Umezawaea sp. Da 62-37]
MEDNLATVEHAMVEIRRRQTRRALARTAPAHDPAAFDVLDVIEAAERTDQPATVTTVATDLAVDQPRASKLVARAVTAGLVERIADQQDGRRAFLRRTDAGRDASAQVHATRQKAFDQAMHDWTDAERAEFARLVLQFANALP